MSSKRQSNIKVKQLKEFINTLDEDTDFLIALGDTLSPLYDVLTSLDGSTVTFIDHTYIENCCKIIGEKKK